MRRYSLIQNVYNWGASFSKAIINHTKLTKTEDYFVHVQKYDKFENLLEEGERKVLNAYQSDVFGKKDEKGEHVTLELDVDANLSIASPFYNDPTLWNDGGGAYLKSWAITKYTIRNNETNEVFDLLETILTPDEDRFLYGSYTLKEQTLNYVYYEPEKDSHKHPLVIWLHGYGSGGDDLGFVTGGMLTTNFITKEIQDIFGGAHILMPQAHTAWLDGGDGTYTKDGHSMYSEIVDSLIQNYMDTHEDIDPKRIYIGGCSNGGYMTIRLLLDNIDRYAAGFPICAGFQNEWVSDEDIQTLKKVPLWFVHATNDHVVEMKETALPIYERLKEAGHTNLHFTKYDQVIDPDFGNEYIGHFTWVYSLKNLCKEDFDGSPVKVNEKEATLYEWVASQCKD